MIPASHPGNPAQVGSEQLCPGLLVGACDENSTRCTGKNRRWPPGGLDVTAKSAAPTFFWTHSLVRASEMIGCIECTGRTLSRLRPGPPKACSNFLPISLDRLQPKGFVTPSWTPVCTRDSGQSLRRAPPRRDRVSGASNCSSARIRRDVDYQRLVGRVRVLFGVFSAAPDPCQLRALRRAILPRKSSRIGQRVEPGCLIIARPFAARFNRGGAGLSALANVTTVPNIFQAASV